MKFPYYIQADAKDCGPTCLKIIARYYDKIINIQELRKLSENTREGSSMLGISEAAEKIGFRTIGVRLSLDNLYQITLPCILHWNKNHYVVLYKIKKNKYYISDPNYGLVVFNESEFLQHWIGNNSNRTTEEGVVLMIEPTPKFYETEYDSKDDHRTIGIKFLIRYLYKYKSFIVQLCIGLVAASLLQLVFPFLTQSVVDIGIQNQDINFIYLVLFAQLFLFIGRTVIEVLRSWILLHLSTRINIALISDFFIKLMNLSISFFDVRMTGDILQRINDHKRIEKVLTTSSLNVFFSLTNLIILGGVLAYYNLLIFTTFLIGSIIYFGWIFIFLKKREELDYRRFTEISLEQSKIIELINGMQEIKLHNAEKQKRWEWEYVQARLFKISIKALTLEQMQNIGSGFINELKNIFIIFLSARLVISGEITLGMMMAINTIVGNLNGPIVQLIVFVREVQDAKISLARLSEIHEKEDEIEKDMKKSNKVVHDADIIIDNISFRYIGMANPVLRNLTLSIPANKVTAIVGASGSGKTTLMKILLKFYEVDEGEIYLHNNTEKIKLSSVAQSSWRNQVGAVMQEGYIFNDTVVSNITIGAESMDNDRLKYACNVANIKDFIENLPLGYNTKIGSEGLGISTGQAQRILIARAVYKNPEIIFFDEATSALDASNEKIILKNLDIFFKDKTVVVIAHRLSTVMNADQIVVLDKGSIIEKGTHGELIAARGNYYELVRNQLQLGN